MRRGGRGLTGPAIAAPRRHRVAAAPFDRPEAADAPAEPAGTVGRRMRRSTRALSLALVAAAASATPALATPLVAAGSTGSSPVMVPTLALTMGPAPRVRCAASPGSDPLLALSSRGEVVSVAQRRGRTAVLAGGADPAGGLAVGPRSEVAYVSAPGPGGVPAVWSVPLSGCHRVAHLIEPDAELPSVSPDGTTLAYASLDRLGLQQGVALVHLDRRGRAAGAVRLLPAASTPPPLEITGLAVGRHGDQLAVWGGFVDLYLGPRHPTVGTLDPAVASSLRAAAPVFDERGISLAIVPPRAPRGWKPEAWQAAPAYQADGTLVVAGRDGGVLLPFSGAGGGGIRYVVEGTGPLRSLAAGPDGALAWVTDRGSLVVARHAVDLPFGPAATTTHFPASAATLPTVPGRYAAVAWTAGPSAERTPPAPRVFVPVQHLQSLVGMSQAAATRAMAALDLPVMVHRVGPQAGAPPGTVVAQSPPAGYGVACQCAVTLDVASGS